MTFKDLKKRVTLEEPHQQPQGFVESLSNVDQIDTTVSFSPAYNPLTSQAIIL
ncbi:MAG: hypothetical protein ACJ71P_03500 [Nitrososphaeraceae archaeon]